MKRIIILSIILFVACATANAQVILLGRHGKAINLGFGIIGTDTIKIDTGALRLSMNLGSGSGSGGYPSFAAPSGFGVTGSGTSAITLTAPGTTSEYFQGNGTRDSKSNLPVSTAQAAAIALKMNVADSNKPAGYTSYKKHQDDSAATAAALALKVSTAKNSTDSAASAAALAAGLATRPATSSMTTGAVPFLHSSGTWRNGRMFYTGQAGSPTGSGVGTYMLGTNVLPSAAQQPALYVYGPPTAPNMGVIMTEGDSMSRAKVVASGGGKYIEGNLTAFGPTNAFGFANSILLHGDGDAENITFWPNLNYANNPAKAGSVRFRIGLVYPLVIDTGGTNLLGALKLNNNPGVAGQIPVSAGPGQPPIWANQGAGTLDSARVRQIISDSLNANTTYFDSSSIKGSGTLADKYTLNVKTINGTPIIGAGNIVITGGSGGGVSSVDVSGGTTGLTTSGGPVTGSGTITITGTLSVANGGTGATSATSARSNLGLGTAAVLNVAASGNAASGEVVKGNDTRLTDSRTPTGSAGGDLTGTYPNPTLTSVVTAGNCISCNLTYDAKGRITVAANGGVSSATLDSFYNRPMAIPGGFALVTRGGRIDSFLFSSVGAGDASTNTSTSVDGEVALFSGTAGKTLKRATGTGIAKVTSGVLSVAIAGTDYVTPTGNTTLTNKTLTQPAYTSQTLTDGSTVTWNSTNGTIATVTIAGNRTLVISNAVANTFYKLNVIQDGTGSRTMTWPAAFKWKGGTAPTLTTTAGAKDIITFFYDGTVYEANYGLDYK